MAEVTLENVLEQARQLSFSDLQIRPNTNL
jgi:hypothetical protein